MSSGPHGVSIQIGGLSVPLDRTTQIEISLPQNGGESGQLTIESDDETDASSVTLTSLLHGSALRRESWSFADAINPKSGTDGPRSRVRGVTLLDYTGLWDEPVAGGRGLIGLPPTPPRYQAVAYDIDKPLGSDLPDGEECEEKRRSGSISFPGAAQATLQIAGMDVRLIPGPGYVSRDVDDDYSVKGKSIGQVLSELLFTNGVRWWLEGDLVVVDGRELPSGVFRIPVSDKDDVADYSFSDEIAELEFAPELGDYVARCAESIITEDPAVKGTFETNESGSYSFFEQSGSLGIGSNEGDYASVRGEVIKAGGQIVSRVEQGEGYKSVPNSLFGGNQQLGPTYVKTLTNTFHATVPAALVSSVERTRTYADMAVLQGLEPGGGDATELQAILFRDLQLKSPYISEEKVVNQRWNAEGLLRRRSEITREFSGLAVQDIGGTPRVRLLYKDGLKIETWTPSGGGKYEYYVSGYTMVDQPVYEISDDPDAAPEAIGITSNRIPFSFREETDSPPPSVSMPLPTCEEVDTCLNDAEREYQRDLADWRARQVNNVPKRVHSVRFGGCLKLGLKRGQSYGGGYVLDVTHNVDRGSLSTSVTVVTAIE